MSEFQRSMLVFVLLLFVLVAGYSFWQIRRTRTRMERNGRNGNKPTTRSEPTAYTYVPMKKNPLPLKGLTERNAAQSEFEADTVPQTLPTASITPFVMGVNPAADTGAETLRHSLQPSVVPSAPTAVLPTDRAITAAMTPVDSNRPPVVANAANSVPTNYPEHLMTDTGVNAVQTSNPPSAARYSFDSFEPPIEAYLHEPMAHQSAFSEVESDFDYSDEEARLEMAARMTQQELDERSTWAVFTPLHRWQAWLANAYPSGTPPVTAIETEVLIHIAQPKRTQDILSAIADLQLPHGLPMRLQGARAGQVGLPDLDADAGQAEKHWQDLEAGVAYNALRFSLQLASPTAFADEGLMQQWLSLTERLRKRVAGKIDTLPDVAHTAQVGQFLYGMARRLGQPWIVQLHKKNGLWSAQEVHQQLTAIGARLHENGVYVAGEQQTQGDGWLYTVVNDVANARAQDFSREQMNLMYVHTLSFCLDSVRLTHPEMAMRQMIAAMRVVADALQAQWQNSVGERIVPDLLNELAGEHLRGLTERLDALGLPVGSLKIKRLLAG